MMRFTVQCNLTAKALLQHILSNCNAPAQREPSLQGCQCNMRYHTIRQRNDLLPATIQQACRLREMQLERVADIKAHTRLTTGAGNEHRPWHTLTTFPNSIHTHLRMQPRQPAIGIMRASDQFELITLSCTDCFEEPLSRSSVSQ